MNFGEDESIDNMQKVTKKSHSFKKTNMTGFGNFDNDLNDSEYNWFRFVLALLIMIF